MILEKKHINKRKPFDADDEWGHLGEGVGEKIESGDVMDIQDRAITFNDDNYVKTKEEDYKIESEKFKEKFGNTAQYLKFVNAHLSEKKNHLNKILADRDRFYDDLATLNPEMMSKDQLDKKNYTKLKSDDVRKALEFVEEERNSLKDKIEHFGLQIDLAKRELTLKDKQIEEIKTELNSSDSKEEPLQLDESQQKNAIDSIQNELKNLVSKNESEKIFGAINSLIILLNSKNESTLNELKSVKNEFNKMKQDYDKVISSLEKKK